MFLKLVPTKGGKSLWLRAWPECQPSAISHQPPQRLCNVCCTRPTDVWDECQWGSSLLLLLFFVGSWSLSNIWTPPPPHSLKTNPALNALKRKKKAVTRCKFRVNCAPRRWVVLTPGYLSPVHFTFYPLRHVFFFPCFFFSLHLSPLSTPPAPPSPHLLSTKPNLHRPSFHSNRLPWKLGDSAVHPILLSPGLEKRCFSGRGKFVLSVSCLPRNRDETAAVINTFAVT